MENSIAADPNMRFYILMGLSGFIMVVLSLLWVLAAAEDEMHEQTQDFWAAVFMCFQVLITGGYTSAILEIDQRIIFFLMIGMGTWGAVDCARGVVSKFLSLSTARAV